MKINDIAQLTKFGNYNVHQPMHRFNSYIEDLVTDLGLDLAENQDRDLNLDQ